MYEIVRDSGIYGQLGRPNGGGEKGMEKEHEKGEEERGKRKGGNRE